MRFNWRSHLVVTALTALSVLPIVGCSSQQQQLSDEVEATEGEEGGGEENAQANAQNSENADAEGGEEGNQAVTNEEVSNVEGGEGEEVVNNTDSESNTAAAEGDLQEIINEMGGNNATANTATEAPVNAAATEAMPAETVAEVPAPMNVAPTNAAEMPAEGGAPVASAVPGLPEMGSKMPYVVKAGDTLGKIATKVYGDQKRWRDISDLTGLSNPNHIYPGDVVFFTLEDSSMQFASNYMNLKRGQEVAREGDSLASIARRVYGSSNEWRHIWRQNDNIDNPDKLSPGTVIYYIEKAGMDSAFNLQLKNLKFENVPKNVKQLAKTTSTLIQLANVTLSNASLT
jgi:nucleoid-associated protein YgaU